MPKKFMTVWLIRISIPAFFLIVILMVQYQLRQFVKEKDAVVSLNFELLESIAHWQSLHGDGGSSVDLPTDVSFDEDRYLSWQARRQKDADNYQNFGLIYDQPDAEVLEALHQRANGCLRRGDCREILSQVLNDTEATSTPADGLPATTNLRQHYQDLNERLPEVVYEDWYWQNADQDTDEVNRQWQDEVSLIGAGHFAEVWRQPMVEQLAQRGLNTKVYSLSEFPQVAKLTRRLVNGVSYRGRISKDVVYLDQMLAFVDQPLDSAEKAAIYSDLRLPLLFWGKNAAVAAQVDGRTGYPAAVTHGLAFEPVRDERLKAASWCRIERGELHCDWQQDGSLMVLSGDGSPWTDALREKLHVALQSLAKRESAQVIWDLSTSSFVALMGGSVNDAPYGGTRFFLTRAWRELAMFPSEIDWLVHSYEYAYIVLDPGLVNAEAKSLFLGLKWYHEWWQDWLPANLARIAVFQSIDVSEPASQAYVANLNRLVWQWLTSAELDVVLFHQRGYNQLGEPSFYQKNLPAMAIDIENLEQTQLPF